jgi:hypothetical protein
VGKRDYIGEALIAEAIGNAPHTLTRESANNDMRFSNPFPCNISTAIAEHRPSAAVAKASNDPPIHKLPVHLSTSLLE